MCQEPVKRRRSAWARLGAAATLVWMVGGTVAFVCWQAAEGKPVPRDYWWNGFEAAALVAAIAWILIGIGHGVVRWIVTGRGPRA